MRSSVSLSVLRRGQDVSALEAVAAEMANTPKAILHVNFKDGSDSHPGRTIVGDLAEVCVPTRPQYSLVNFTRSWLHVHAPLNWNFKSTVSTVGVLR